MTAGLIAAGHDAVHVRDLGLAAASDPMVMATATAQHRVLVSGDTDFGTLLYESGSHAPSLVLFRREIGRRPEQQLRVLLANLPQFRSDLDKGALVVIEDARVRVRPLPLG